MFNYVYVQGVFNRVSNVLRIRQGKLIQLEFRPLSYSRGHHLKVCFVRALNRTINCTGNCTDSRQFTLKTQCIAFILITYGRTLVLPSAFLKYLAKVLSM